MTPVEEHALKSRPPRWTESLRSARPTGRLWWWSPCREVRRHQALRNVEILKASGPNPYPDLEGALSWVGGHPVDVD